MDSGRPFGSRSLTALCDSHNYRSGILWLVMIPDPNILWKVEINSGARASLTAPGKRKQIWRPQMMSREEFFRWLPEGKQIENETVEKVLKLWS